MSSIGIRVFANNNSFLYIICMLLASLLQFSLSLDGVEHVTDIATHFIYYHALPAHTFPSAIAVGVFDHSIAITISFHEIFGVNIFDQLRMQVTLAYLSYIGKFMVGYVYSQPWESMSVA